MRRNWLAVMNVLICANFIALPCKSVAQSELSPREVMDGFCDNIASDPEKAADFVVSSINFGTTQTASQLEANRLGMVNSFELSQNSYGRIKNCSFGYEASIGKDLTKFVYVVTYEIRPVLASGHFIADNNGWRMFHFNFSDDTADFPYVVK